jgi:hypothetical protein
VLLFVYQLFPRQVPTVPVPRGDRAEDARPHGATADMAKLIEAFAKLADSLAKMGPLAMSMFGAVFFMIVALLAAGGTR